MQVPIPREILNITLKMLDIVVISSIIHSYGSNSKISFKFIFDVSQLKEPDVNILAISTFAFSHFNSTATVRHLLKFVRKFQIRLQHKLNET